MSTVKISMTKRYFVFVVIFVFWSVGQASHFRGGTISWKPTSNPLEVEFSYKLGWTYGHGAGCTAPLQGQYVNGSTFPWYCTSGCTTRMSIGSFGYMCVAASTAENWELGEFTFLYTFPNKGLFEIEYTGSAWISLDYGLGGGSWRVGTTVDLRTRSDTGNPNYSPVSIAKPLYTFKYGCIIALRIPVVDQEGDNVRCRWSVSSECVSVCNAIPNTVLDEENCILYINATHHAGGMYAVAVTIEDRPRTNITLDGQLYTPNDTLSSVPVQFLVNTPQMSHDCSVKPVFMKPTPPENSQIVLKPGETLYVSLYATSNTSDIASFTIFGPAGVRESQIWNVAPIRSSVWGTDIIWTPTVADKGPVTVCAEAVDVAGMSSDLRCFTVVAWDEDPCDSSKCMNNATCSRLGFSDKYLCVCEPGYTGTFCELEINECASDPCMHDGTCTDQLNAYVCHCPSGFTSTNCEIDIDECASSPCVNSGTCYDLPNAYVCVCPNGFTSTNCETEIDECASNPCMNNATCLDLLNEYFCACEKGYTSRNCEIDINECVLQPCENGGTCMDLPGYSECHCGPGFSGTVCQTGFDICASMPCKNGGACLPKGNGSYEFSCHCVDGWQGRYCSYRRENPVLHNNSLMAADYMQYSSCNCFLGSEEKDLCYAYKDSKALLYGLLASLLGVITAILLYLLFTCLRNCPPRDKVKPLSLKPTVTPTSDVTIKEKEHDHTSGPGRVKHCWACEVKAMSRKPVPARSGFWLDRIKKF